ncbi:MAG: hypothetical protein WA130_01885 [Candidatus Methanoperedens sp.]
MINIKCGNCGKKVHEIKAGKKRPNFCPHCGVEFDTHKRSWAEINLGKDIADTLKKITKE